MKKLTTLTLIFYLLLSSMLHAQNVMRVMDSDSWGWGNEGSAKITEANISIMPQGIYTAVGLTLTVGDHNYSSESDDLEIILDFTLPEGSIINDSWLWMLDQTTIVQADVLELQSASQTYEDIVDRQTDPSLLYRKSNNKYRMKVFPLSTGQTRKFRISYLVPSIWSEEEIKAFIPTEILNTSAIEIPDIRIWTRESEQWKNPQLIGTETAPFEPFLLEEHGEVLLTTISHTDLTKPLYFTTDAPFNEDGIYASNFIDGNDQFYQLAYMPPTILENQDSKNILFVNGHDPKNTHVSQKDIMNYLKDVYPKFMQEGDQINFICENDSGREFLSDTWMTPDAFLTNMFFEDPEKLQLSQGNIVAQIVDALEFVKANGEAAEIFILTSEDWLDLSGLDKLKNDYSDLFSTNKVQVTIINYQSKNYYQNTDQWGFGQVVQLDYISSYYQSYQNLSYLTGGKLYSGLEGNGNIWANVEAAFKSLRTSEYIFDLHTSISGGLAYNDYVQTYMGQSLLPNVPILQTGRYLGQGQLDLSFTGLSDGDFISEQIAIPMENIVVADSLLREMWTGNHIKTLNNAQDIIRLSRAERVLSDFTAFLAVDLENGANPCHTCDVWGGWIVAVEEQESNSEEENSGLTASPNPFSDQTTIRLNISNRTSLKNVNIQIFDSMGTLLITDETKLIAGKDILEWTWSGRNAAGQKMPSGIYHVVIQLDGKPMTLKLVLI